MSWKKTDLVLRRRFNQHGLGPLLEAGQICRKAEQLCPEILRAISVRNTILHLAIKKENLLAFKLIEGRLITELNSYATEYRLPEIRRVRLTFCKE